MWLQSFFKNSKQTSTIVNCTTLTPTVWGPRNYHRLAEEGYQSNVIVYRSITLIARAVASLPWYLYQKDMGQKIPHHPLLTLLNKPNPIQNFSSFMEELVSHLLLSGNAYIEALENQDQKLCELHILRPDRVKIIPGADGLPCAYTYTVDSCTKKIPICGLHSPILHTKFFHPLNDWYGLSPLEAAARSVDQHNCVGGHNLALMQNGGRPSGALLVKANLSEEQRGQLRHDLENNYQSLKNSGKMMILEGDFEWKEMGLSPKDLDFISGKNLSAREITQAFGVPPMLAGIPGDSTYSNYKEARFHLWEDTVLPLIDRMINEFNTWLTPRYGSRLSLRYTVDQISALEPRNEMKWKKISDCPFLTVNEKRQALGFAPLPGGDTLFEPEKNVC